MKIFFILLLLVSSSCSVMMASKRDGVEIDSIQNIENRSQMIALGAETTSSLYNDEGELVETYKILQEKGSLARAIMHGLLDISTAFIWEFAGTPIESTLCQKKFISIKVTYDSHDKIKKMELF